MIRPSKDLTINVRRLISYQQDNDKVICDGLQFLLRMRHIGYFMDSKLLSDLAQILSAKSTIRRCSLPV